MKCPTCGAPNKSTNKACYRCGSVLDDRSVQPRGNANSLWYNAAEKREKPVPPPFWGDTRSKPTYDDKSDFIVLHDEESNANAAQDLVDRGAPVPDNRQKLGWMSGRREIQVVVPASGKPRGEALGIKRYRIRWRRLVAVTAVILLLSAGVGYGVFLLYRAATGYASQLFAGSRANAAAKDPLVEKAVIDGATWHKVTFFGKDGDMVMLDDPKKSIPIVEGKAEIMLEDQGYIPEDLTEDSVTVSLVASVVDPNGKVTKVNVPPYTIDVPLAPLKIILPKEQENITTDADNILIKIKVTPGSKRVMIGDVNKTDAIDAEGYTSESIPLKASSMNTITIYVDTENYRKNTFELKVNRPTMYVPIELTNPTTRTDAKTVKIAGSTVQGATININGKDVTVKSTGSFSYTAPLKAWGWNDIVITATSGNHSSTMTHRVYHTPTEPGYSMAAQVIDYNYLMDHTKAVMGRIYCIEGTVMNAIESDISDYYMFEVGEPGSLKYVVIENTTESEPKVGQCYRLFVDASGEKLESYPVLVLRNEKLMQEKTPSTASPSPSSTPQATAGAGN
jgi:hypothetical protein